MDDIHYLTTIDRADIEGVARMMTDHYEPVEAYVLADRIIALGQALKELVKADAAQELAFTINTTKWGDKISVSYVKSYEYEKDAQYQDIEAKLEQAKLEVAGLDGTLKAMQKQQVKDGRATVSDTTPRIVVSKK